MSAISIETKKVSELSEVSSLNDTDLIIVNDGTGMKKVSLETFKSEWGVTPLLEVTAPTGSAITVTDGTTTLRDEGGTVTFSLPNYGTWTITITLSGQTATRSVVVDTMKLYKETMAYFAATISTTFPNGATCTCSDGTTTLTSPVTTGSYDFVVPNAGTWTVTATDGGSNTVQKSVSITTDGQTENVALSFVKIYGIQRSTSGTGTAWTRTDEAIGKTATASVGTTAGSSDFDDCYPWSEMERETLASGDVMVKIPEFYYQRYVDSGVEHIRIADGAYEGFTKHPGSGKYVGAYKTSSNNKSVTSAAPTVSQTRATMRTNAKNKGTGWSLIDAKAWSAIIMLFLVEFADNNGQAKIGRGYCDKTSNGSAINTGSCDNVANLTGRPTGTDGLTDVVYRGIEGIWGNIWEWVDGINFNNGAYYVCTNPDNYADDTATMYTLLSYTGATNWSSSYISAEGLDTDVPWAMFPSAAGTGSESTYYADGCWSSTGWRVCIRSGLWNTGSLGGLFTCVLDAASSSTGTSLGSRLLYDPEV